jgi:hypothetical protein
MNLSYRVGDDPDNVLKNRRLFFGRLGISPDRIAVPGQVHGDTILSIDAPGDYPACDGLVTRSEGVFLCVTTADCIPALLFDPPTEIVAVVHAGWRGTSLGILSKAVRMLKEEFGVNVRTLQAFLGPGAGPCCYSVGEDVAARFPSQFVIHRDGRVYLDLQAANGHQLREAGLLPENTETSSYCTICSAELFHSYRRDREKSGRMMGVIGLAP